MNEADVLAAREKLKAKFSQVRTGGRGTVRRKKKAVQKVSSSDDKKLQSALKRLGVNPIPAIEEVCLYKDDDNVVVFKNPKVQASIGANTYVISGQNDTQPASSLMSSIPGMPDGLDPQQLMQMQQLMQQAQAQKAASGEGAAETTEENTGNDDDDDVPEVVDDFEKVSEQAEK